MYNTVSLQDLIKKVDKLMRFVVTLDEKKDKMAVAICKAAGRKKKKLLLHLIESYINNTEIETISDVENVNIFELKGNKKNSKDTEINDSLKELITVNKEIASSIRGLMLQESTINHVKDSANSPGLTKSEASKPDDESLPDAIMENLLGNIDLD